MAKLKFENAFSAVYDSVAKQSFIDESVSIEKAQDEFLTPAPTHKNEYKLQELIRPCFGKQHLNNNKIGTPKEFKYLENQRHKTENHYIVTLFVDIKGSTRLNLLKEIEDVYLFKNAVIQTCIEVIRSLDGHIHRIMGDAVMAFFGGKSIAKEDAVADAINCSVVLRALLENSIKPYMEQQGWEAKDIGFRVGIEFGDTKEVLWAAYGYAGVSEVTATGLPIDMASKLQGEASKNDTMLGQKLLEFVNWPVEYSDFKYVQKDGVDKAQKYVTPNITNKNGEPINYLMRLLSYDKCLQYLALPTDIKQHLTDGKVIHHNHIKFKCYVEEEEEWREYISASHYLEKELSLKFIIQVNTLTVRCPLTVRVTKTNHGSEVPESELEEIKPPITILQHRGGRYQTDFNKEKTILEGTQYRGLHTMKCEVIDSTGKVMYRNWIAVLIK